MLQMNNINCATINSHNTTIKTKKKCTKSAGLHPVDHFEYFKKLKMFSKPKAQTVIINKL